jgi:hypothetical protein
VNDAERRALVAFPELRGLIDLRETGWAFQLISAGGVVQVKGIRVWRTAGMLWGDLLQVKYSTDAVAVRLNPNREVVWKYEGDLTGAVDALLALPAPGDPSAPRLVVGSPRTLWTP